MRCRLGWATGTNTRLPETATDARLRRRAAAARRRHLEHTLHPRVKSAVELVGAGVERLDPANRRRLPSTDEVALELPVVVDEVVLREVVEVGEGELVAVR